MDIIELMESAKSVREIKYMSPVPRHAGTNAPMAEFGCKASADACQEASSLTTTVCSALLEPNMMRKLSIVYLFVNSSSKNSSTETADA